MVFGFPLGFPSKHAPSREGRPKCLWLKTCTQRDTFWKQRLKPAVCPSLFFQPHPFFSLSVGSLDWWFADNAGSRARWETPFPNHRFGSQPLGGKLILLTHVVSLHSQNCMWFPMWLSAVPVIFLNAFGPFFRQAMEAAAAEIAELQAGVAQPGPWDGTSEGVGRSLRCVMG